MSDPSDYEDCGCAKCCLPTIVQERDEAYARGKAAERERCRETVEEIRDAYQQSAEVMLALAHAYLDPDGAAAMASVPLRKCLSCGGNGNVVHAPQDPSVCGTRVELCQTCGGTGHVQPVDAAGDDLAVQPSPAEEFESSRHWESAQRVLAAHGMDPANVLAKAAAVCAKVPSPADVTADPLGEKSAGPSDAQISEAESRARHTPLSADPYTKGLAAHVESLADEVRRLRAELRLGFTLEQMYETVKQRDEARAEAERLRASLECKWTAADDRHEMEEAKLRAEIERLRAEWLTRQQTLAHEADQCRRDLASAVDTCLDLRKRLSGYEALRAEAWRLRDALRYAIDHSNDRGVIAEARLALAEGGKA